MIDRDEALSIALLMALGGFIIGVCCVCSFFVEPGTWGPFVLAIGYLIGITLFARAARAMNGW